MEFKTKNPLVIDDVHYKVGVNVLHEKHKEHHFIKALIKDKIIEVLKHDEPEVVTTEKTEVEEPKVEEQKVEEPKDEEQKEDKKSRKPVKR